jgi:hypothetical protein
MMTLTTFKHIQEGQRFQVVWATDERPIAPPWTIYTRVPETSTDEGSFNATATVDGRLIGVSVNDQRAVIAVREAAPPEPMADLASSPRHAYAQN